MMMLLLLILFYFLSSLNNDEVEKKIDFSIPNEVKMEKSASMSEQQLKIP